MTLTASRGLPVRGAARVHGPWVGLIVAVAAAGYTLVGYLELRGMRAGVLDLAIFDQGVRSYSEFRLPESVTKEYLDGFHDEGFSLLGDHWSPILALLAPLYWINDGPMSLLFAQGVLFALAVPPLWLFTRRRLGPAAAYLVSLAYVVCWPVAQAVEFDFHEVAFAPPLIAWMVERYDAGRIRTAVVMGGLLLLTKEDMGLVVAGFGLYLAARGRFRAGALLVGGGVAAVLVATKVLIPFFGGRDGFYWRYEDLGDGPFSALAHVLTHPVQTLALLGSPPDKLVTMGWLLLMVLGACLLSPLALLSLPLLAERMLSSYPHWWGVPFHYNAFLAIPLFLAAVDGIARFGPRTRVTWAAGVLVTGLVTAPMFAYGTIVKTELGPEPAYVAVARRAVAAVPPGPAVAAALGVGASLTARNPVILWEPEPGYENPPWIVAFTRWKTTPFDSVEQQVAEVARLRATGYVTVFDEGGFVVLRRP
ncbi:DUF2079 domain-containing protein [Herbidospora daliensis]|uniref:DUF2079 domain-containing protein n=1 Tax=Herbidospora daliensis TaxID=295585 RepID=UPI0009FDC2F0|nr:DUF2079 domain-containing protein [Herbidospora daliensis]